MTCKIRSDELEGHHSLSCSGSFWRWIFLKLLIAAGTEGKGSFIKSFSLDLSFCWNRCDHATALSFNVLFGWFILPTIKTSALWTRNRQVWQSTWGRAVLEHGWVQGRGWSLGRRESDCWAVQRGALHTSHEAGAPAPSPHEASCGRSL